MSKSTTSMPGVIDQLRRGFEETHVFRDEKTAQRESFQAGYPANVPGSFVRTSRVKNFGQALEALEKQAFRRRNPSPERADVHGPRVQKELRVERLRAGISFPMCGTLLAPLVISIFSYVSK